MEEKQKTAGELRREALLSRRLLLLFHLNSSFV